MLKVYFTASTSYNGELLSTYQKIFNLIKSHPVKIISGRQVVYEKTLKQDKKLTAYQIYKRQAKLIDEADFIIAEASKPSLGVGSEIVYALSKKKPVLALVKSSFEDKISPLIAGNPSENLYLEYYADINIKSIIKKYIVNISQLLKHQQTLRKKTGRLIVIDGVDGSGKTVQAKLLVNYLKKNGYLVGYFDFPQYYQSFHGKIVAQFLRGEFGNINQVSPYLISLAYALDRASVKEAMIDILKKNGYIVANRYTTSSMAHQAAKFQTEKERENFLKWITELEYKVHKIPKENLVIYLYLPWQESLKLTAKKGARPYLNGRTKDIHERNIFYIKSTQIMYLELAQRYRHWVKIDCMDNKKLLPPQKIHQKIINALKIRKII